MSPTDASSSGNDGPPSKVSNFSRSKQLENLPQRSPSKMTTLHLPLPRLPTPPTTAKYHFGPELRPTFSENTRFDNMSNRQRSFEIGRPASREQLPPVSQLFTSASDSSISSTNISPHHITSSPTDARAHHMSPFRGSTSDLQRHPSSYPFPSLYPRTPPIQSHLAPPRRESLPLSAIITQQSPTRFERNDSILSPYTAYSESSSYDYQHPSIVPSLAGSSRWYPDQHSSFETISRPVSAPVPVEKDESDLAKVSLRVVKEENIPGEGPCWVYEDGSHVRKIIDGETVNAQWGVTKAGKPRKRLAIACTTCREKKVKCDPGEPKCVQCDKFGRECRFQTT